jgi:hypothetical protein
VERGVKRLRHQRRAVLVHHVRHPREHRLVARVPHHLVLVQAAQVLGEYRVAVEEHLRLLELVGVGGTERARRRVAKDGRHVADQQRHVGRLQALHRAEAAPQQLPRARDRQMSHATS